MRVGGVTVADEHDLAVSFSGFVISLTTTAAVHFGDYPDPVTGETKAPNLEAASQMIDILAMLTHKRSFTSSIFNRSMTKQMSYHAKVPLLAIPV